MVHHNYRTGALTVMSPKHKTARTQWDVAQGERTCTMQQENHQRSFFLLPSHLTTHALIYYPSVTFPDLILLSPDIAPFPGKVLEASERSVNTKRGTNFPNFVSVMRAKSNNEKHTKRTKKTETVEHELCYFIPPPCLSHT